MRRWLNRPGLLRIAFRRLYDLTHRRLFGVAFLLLKRRDAAKDVVQDAFIRIWTWAGIFDASKANLLSTPSITTLDNQPAEIVFGQNVPFRTGSFATDGNTTMPFTTIERKDVGITSRVVPRVNQGEVIQIDISQEVSSLARRTVAGAADLVTNHRSIKATVLADNGKTIVLGG